MRLEDTKTGPRTVWLGPEATRLLAAVPRTEGAERVFPEDVTSARLYTFWRGIREQAELPGLRIHDCRHTWSSQGVMNGVGLTTVGRLLGHRKRRTTAIYAHLDDAALQDAAPQAAGVISQAMGFKEEPSPAEKAEGDDGGASPAPLGGIGVVAALSVSREFPRAEVSAKLPNRKDTGSGSEGRARRDLLTVIGRPTANNADYKRPPSRLVRICLIRLRPGSRRAGTAKGAIAIMSLSLR